MFEKVLARVRSEYVIEQIAEPILREASSNLEAATFQTSLEVIMLSGESTWHNHPALT